MTAGPRWARIALVSVAAVVGAIAVVACTTRAELGAPNVDGAIIDGPAPVVDTSPPDQSIWRDATPIDARPTPDSPPRADTYRGTPFGCADDADCFGTRCCATPWGIKLCQDRCAGR